tara:strand:- start:297 stop:974 length:678 start_codon:yes stop_codon:yes gene_type:complete
MAKKTAVQKKTETPTTDTATVATTVDDSSTKKTTKKTTKKACEPVVTTSPVENEVVETTTTTTTTSDVSVLADSFTEFMTKFQTLVNQMSTLKADFKTLEKKAVREIKIAQKEKAKRRRKTGNRSPSGFVKPTLISSELAKFLGKPNGTEMARTEVTREINGYIRLHSLQDKSNGRKINPDKALASLLKIQSGDELTYFNLQRYMSPHFAKANTAPAASTTATSS